MKKYYEGDTGGRYLVSAKSVGFFADVQTVAQAEDAARLWWALTGDDGEVVIRLREKETVVKVVRRETGEEKQMAKRKLDEREFVEKFSYHAWSEGSMEVNGKVRRGCMFNLDKITDDEVAYLKSFCNVRLTSWQYRWAPEIRGAAVFIAY